MKLVELRKPSKNQYATEALKSVLEMAEAGDVQDVVIVYVKMDGSATYSMSIPNHAAVTYLVLHVAADAIRDEIVE